MTQLAHELKKYYSRYKSRLVFKGGYTLNSLSLEMYERLGYQQIDASVVSRVLSGKRLFTVKQLEIFCEILHLRNEEKTKLSHSLLNDYLIRKGHDTSLLLAPR